MNLLHSVQLATQVYAKLAYPEGVPARVSEAIDGLGGLADDDAFLEWPFLEQEDGRYFMRLGNAQYPHMKLVILVEKDGPVFYVDAHDSHFQLPAVLEMSESLKRLRETNKRIKQRIEVALASDRLAVFGLQIPETIAVPTETAIRVMAIDDEMQILDMLGLIVTRMGAYYQSAQTVAKAKALIEERGLPDIVFCDIMMPDESGYDFVNWLAAEGHEIPVYYITGLNMEKVDRTGVIDVLQKPFKAKRLMTILRDLAMPPEK